MTTIWKKKTKSVQDSVRHNPELGLRGKLLRSHLIVGGIGLLALAIKLLISVDQQSYTERLTKLRGPMLRASMQASLGVEQSMAALRSWVIIGEPSLKAERTAAWEHRIDPAIKKLQVLSQAWDTEGAAQIDNLATQLNQLKALQNQIVELAQKPGNKAAEEIYASELEPISTDIFNAITHCIEIEKNLPETNRKSLLAAMADLRGFFSRSRSILLSSLDHSEISQIEELPESIRVVRDRLDYLLARESELSAQQKPLVNQIDRGLGEYESLATKVFQEVMSASGNGARRRLMDEATLLGTSLTNQLGGMIDHKGELMQQEAESISSHANFAILSALGLMLAIAVSSVLVSDRRASQIADPIIGLASEMDKLSSGESCDELPILSEDELGKLTNSFNLMRSTIEERASEITQANLDLQRLEKRLRAIFEAAPVGFVMINEQREIVLVNGQTEELFGYTREELLNQPIEILVPERYRPDHPSKVEGYLEKPASIEIGLDRSLFGVRKDGSEFPVEIGLNPVITDEGVFVLSAIADVTKAQEATLAIKESESRFRTIADSSPLGMWVCDSDMACSWVNKHWLDYTGTTMEENQGSYWAHLIHPDEHKSTSEALMDAFQQRKRYLATYRLRRQDGTYRWHQAVGNPRYDEEGNFIGYVGISIDVNDQRLTQKKQELTNHTLKQSQAIQRTLIDKSRNLIGLLEVDGTLIDVNRTALKAAGVDHDEVLGCDFWDTPWWSHSEGLQSQLKDAVKKAAQGEQVSFETQHFDEAGNCIDIDFSLKPVIDDQGQVIFLVPEGCDITLHKNREAELSKLLANLDRVNEQLGKANSSLQESEKLAQQASQTKSDFLANMSHEIRTPMNAIIGLTSIVLESELTELQRDYLTTVSDSSEALLQIINDILDFSKIEASKLELEKIDFQIRDVIGRLLKTSAVKAQQKDLGLVLQIASGVPESLVGDPGRLRQILINLVGNAIKFTDSGQVAIRVSLSESTDEELVELHFIVEDTGIGIDKEQLAKVFEAFEQADISASRKYGGTGLGLTITSRLIEKMQGKIWVESQLGVGTKFHFTARFGKSSILPTASWEEKRAWLSDKRVLVVDDNKVNRMVLDDTIKHQGMLVEQANNGQQALQLLSDAMRNSCAFDFLVSDLHMPTMDGLSLIEEIRKKPDLYGAPTTIVCASSDPEDQNRIQQLQVAAVMHKPVQEGDLFDAMIRGYQGVQADDQGGYPSEATNPTDSDAPLRPLHILLAEDSLPNQKLALALLGREGHKVVVVDNGKAAVEASAEGQFDLVLMDIQMPGMDGLEATAAIRAREAETGTHLPIIALTAHAMKGDRENCLEHGMDGYVTKPIRMADLRTEVNLLLKEFGLSQDIPPETPEEATDDDGDLIPEPAESTNSETGPTLLASQPATKNSAEANSVAVADSNDQPSSASSAMDVEIPWGEMLDYVGGDQESLNEIVGAYAQELIEVTPKFQAAVDEGDAHLVCRTAHKIKSSLRFFKVTEGMALAEQLEQRGAQEQLEGCEQEASLLLRYIESVQSLLDAAANEA